MPMPQTRATPADRAHMPSASIGRRKARATGKKASTRPAEIQLGMVKLVASLSAATITPAGKMARSRADRGPNVESALEGIGMELARAA